MDINRHLNNVALETLHEDTRATLNRQIFRNVYGDHAHGPRIVTSTIVVHYLREAPWPAMLQATVGIGHVGRTSYVASTGLFLDGVCISLCDTVLVLLDDAGPTPIPEDIRTQLASLRLVATTHPTGAE